MGESWRERKNLFIRYSQINFCLDTQIYFASSALASTVIQLFGRGTSLAVQSTQTKFKPKIISNNLIVKTQIEKR